MKKLSIFENSSNKSKFTDEEISFIKKHFSTGDGGTQNTIDDDNNDIVINYTTIEIPSDEKEKQELWNELKTLERKGAIIDMVETNEIGEPTEHRYLLGIEVSIYDEIMK